jgi:hypothetical protein
MKPEALHNVKLVILHEMPDVIPGED